MALLDARAWPPSRCSRRFRGCRSRRAGLDRSAVRGARVHRRDRARTASSARSTAARQGARRSPSDPRAISKPAEARRALVRVPRRFLTEERIDEGRSFWAASTAKLERHREASGVAAASLVAIIGVETFYGRITGAYRVLDALATLAFDYPPRAAYFRGELEQFLLLTREEALDPLTALGSYAGAMGAPQFMPSSYREGRRRRRRRQARPVGRLGRRDRERRQLLRLHGWRAGSRWSPSGGSRFSGDGLVRQARAQRTTVARLCASRGLRFETSLEHAACCIRADSARGRRTAWASRISAITRYNRSALYAMAGARPGARHRRSRRRSNRLGKRNQAGPPARFHHPGP